MWIRAGLAGAAVVTALLAGCGSGGEGGAPTADGNAGPGCLSPAQVSSEESRIAEGFETSHDEVEAKREEIEAVKAEAC